MAIKFNHTIVWARDSEASATFLSQILGLPAPRRWGPFLVVTTDKGTNLDFMNADGEITAQPHHGVRSVPVTDIVTFTEERSACRARLLRHPLQRMFSTTHPRELI